MADTFYLSESLSHELAPVLFYSSVLSDFSCEDGFGAKHRLPYGELLLIPGARVARPFRFCARAANSAIPGTPVLCGAWSVPVVND